MHDRPDLEMFVSFTMAWPVLCWDQQPRQNHVGGLVWPWSCWKVAVDSSKFVHFWSSHPFYYEPQEILPAVGQRTVCQQGPECPIQKGQPVWRHRLHGSSVTWSTAHSPRTSEKNAANHKEKEPQHHPARLFPCSMNLNFHNHLSQSRLNDIANFYPSLSTESTSPQVPRDRYLYQDISPGQVTLQPAALQQPKSCPAPPLANQPKDSPASPSQGTKKGKHFKQSKKRSDKYIGSQLRAKGTNFNMHVETNIHMYTIFLTGALQPEVPMTQVEHLPSTSPLPTHLRQLPPTQVLDETNGQKILRSLPRYPLPSQHDNRKFLRTPGSFWALHASSV